MTNRKIKDYHKNKILRDVLLDNFKMLCTLLILLNEHYPKKFYKLNVQRWLEEYAQTCTMMNDYEKDGGYDWKMKELSEYCGLDDTVCMRIVKKQATQVYNPQNMIVLRDNVKLALIQTALSFGFGPKRLQNIISLMRENSFDDWEQRAKKFGVDINKDMGRLDYRQLKPKEKRDSYSDCKEAVRKLNEYRAYVDYVRQTEDTSA